MNRNKKIILSLLLAACTVLSSCVIVNEEPGKTLFFAMDTFMDVTAYGDQGQAAADQVQEYVNNLESKISRTYSNSDIYRLNHEYTAAIPINEDLKSLLEQAAQYYEQLNHKFDVTIASIEDLWGFTTDSFHIPSPESISSAMAYVGMGHVHWDDENVWLDPGTKLDFGGIAKGYAADRALNIFNDNGIENGLANLGGDLLAKGQRPDGTPWRIAIQDPSNGHDPNKHIGALEATDEYVLTSGNYQRYFTENNAIYHHIIDPQTGAPSQSGLDSVTIISPIDECSGALCDALATSLLIMGKDAALDTWRSFDLNFDAILVTEDNQVILTEGLQKQFKPNTDSGYQFSFVS